MHNFSASSSFGSRWAAMLDLFYELYYDQSVNPCLIIQADVIQLLSKPIFFTAVVIQFLVNL